MQVIFTLAVSGAASALFCYGYRDKKPREKSVAPETLALAYQELLEALTGLSGAVFRVIYHTDPDKPWPDEIRINLEQRQDEIIRLTKAWSAFLPERVLETLRPITTCDARCAGMQEFFNALTSAYDIVSRQAHVALKPRLMTRF